MKKSLCVLSTLLMAASVVAITGCGEKKSNATGTAAAVEAASKMTLTELENASKEEMEASNDTFKVLGLTSTLKTALTAFSAAYDWIHYGEEGVTDNVYVKNDYKDYTLLTALDSAENNYVADFALTQDARSIADYAEGGILHNYVPSDYASLGLKEEDTVPLKGIHFNKIFWTNTNFEAVTGKKLYNIWQVAGTSADADHLDKVSFQTPQTEQINMSFLLAAEAPENQARIEAAYKSYYKKDWSSDTYASAGEQWVTEFIANISRWHSSDGTAMKETQLKDDWTAGYVYYGAFAKMKDAAGKSYDVDLNGDGTLSDDEKGINAMTTVKWDWEIEGFNGFMYTMYSQIINNAKHPYTACLYARYLLNPEMYAAMCHNSSTPNSAGEKSNQYGYYYPGSATTYTTADGKTAAIENDLDWSKSTWIENSLNEDYNYLKTIKSSQVNTILALVASNKN